MFLFKTHKSSVNPHMLWNIGTKYRISSACVLANSCGYTYLHLLQTNIYRSTNCRQVEDELEHMACRMHDNYCRLSNNLCKLSKRSLKRNFHLISLCIVNLDLKSISKLLKSSTEKNEAAKVKTNKEIQPKIRYGKIHRYFGNLTLSFVSYICQKYGKILDLWRWTEAHLEPSGTSMMKCFCEIFNG